jgi:hypothetical protein
VTFDELVADGSWAERETTGAGRDSSVNVGGDAEE